MHLWDWVTIAALCASGAASPGPSLAVVLKNTVEGGRPQGLATGIGHGLGVGIYAFGAVAGFSAIVGTWPALQTVISAAGGLFLVFLGAQSLGSRRTATSPVPHPHPKAPTELRAKPPAFGRAS